MGKSTVWILIVYLIVLFGTAAVFLFNGEIPQINQPQGSD